jgi:hypothetical protein
MSKDVVKSKAFVDGAARAGDLIYIISKDKQLQKDDVSHSSIIGIYQGDWCDVDDTPWASTAIAVAALPQEKMVVVGEDGQVLTYVGGKSTNEQLQPAPTLIRRASTIKGYVYACGAGRQVYKRVGEKKWKNMDAPKPKRGEKVGFEAIHGFAEDEIYAVGWGGEIWHFDGSSWANHAGLTNLILTSVCCAEDDKVYVVGQRGTLIRGRRDKWEIVELGDEFDTDFWDVCWFKKKLYLSTMTGLYTLKGDRLDEVEFDDTLNPSCYRLSTAEGVLWSIGAADVMSFDGKKWRNYTL